MPDFRINPYVAPYAGAPTEAFSQVLDSKIQSFDTNQEFADALGYQSDILLQQVAPFEGDQNYAKQIMGETRKNINQWAQQGDYENMGREVKRGARQFIAQVAPILENQKRYSSYLGEMEKLYKEGKVGLDTYTKAKAASTSGYRGYDPNDPQGSMFSGFTPSADINLTKKVDEWTEGWKASGGSKLIPGDDGSYIERTWEQASESEIRAAAQQALQGDSEFMSYAQSQTAIGNQGRLANEWTGAIEAAVKKHGFVKSKDNLQWIPEYAFNNKQALNIAQNISMQPSPATVNLGADNIYEKAGLTINEQTGLNKMDKLIQQDKNGKYYRFMKNGQLIPKEEYIEVEKATNRTKTGFGQAPGSVQITPESQGYTKQEITREEAASYTEAADKQLITAAANRFLHDAIKKGHIQQETLLNNDEFVKEYLRINKKRYTDPKYLIETRKQYDEAIKNSSVVYTNKRWDISAIPGVTTPEFTSIKDDDALANLQGQSVGVLSTDEGLAGFKGGEIADLNSSLEKMQAEGYKVKSIRKVGPTEFNPFSDLPGMEYAFILENEGDKTTKVASIVVSQQDNDFQPVQSVYSVGYKGMTGNVPFNAPNSLVGPLQGQFRVRTSTDIDSKDGKRKFTSFVEVLDATGKKIPLPGYAQNIPLDKFGEVYQKIFAPKALQKYIAPKFRK